MKNEPATSTTTSTIKAMIIHAGMYQKVVVTVNISPDVPCETLAVILYLPGHVNGLVFVISSCPLTVFISTLLSSSTNRRVD